MSGIVGSTKGCGVQGATVAWQVDVHNVSYLPQLIINWALTTNQLSSPASAYCFGHQG